jgi:hypothetical protein
VQLDHALIAFEPTANLDEVLPLLWDIVDDFNASQRVWSRLSIEGKPRPI